MDAQVRVDISTSYSRKEKRRQVKSNLEAKLQAAYTCIRELELRCAQLPSGPIDPVIAEVEVRLGLVRPMLHSLVNAGQANANASVSGPVRAFRNFGLHADLGHQLFQRFH